MTLQDTPALTDCLFDGDAYLREFEAEVIAVAPDAVALSRTCFFPAGGGQPGDSGVLNAGPGDMTVTGARRDSEEPRRIWHDCVDAGRLLSPGDALRGRIDWPCRHAHMRFHTCLHLLCSLIDAPVTGCGMSAEKARLDFDMPEAVVARDWIDRELNRLVAESHPVRRYTVAASETDVIARLTRTASVAPPVLSGRISMVEVGDVDVQPCGGTHVASTGEIGPVRCSKIEKKGRRNRRVSVVFA